MGGRGKLGAALIKMAVSPVKADREAIARIERECQHDIRLIADLLEDSEMILMTSQTEERISKPKIIAVGIFWAGIIGIAAMLFRPTLMWEGVALGFVVGSSSVVKSKN